MAPSRPGDVTELLALMARLRDPVAGCPWDLAQTFASIAPYTIEEAFEVADAIEREDLPALKDELGDLLLQVVFHARLAEEGGHFTLADVVQGLAEKLVRRHPHVFGTEKAHHAEEVRRRWEAIKAEERRRAGEGAPAASGLPRALPALMRAQKLLARAERAGRLPLPPSDGAGPALPPRGEAALGEALLGLVAAAQAEGLDAESALRRRLRALEEDLSAAGALGP